MYNDILGCSWLFRATPKLSFPPIIPFVSFSHHSWPAGMHPNSRYHSLNLQHCLELHMWHSTPATNYQAHMYVHSRYHCMGLVSKRARTLVVPARSSTRRTSYVFGHCGFDEPLRVNVRYVLLRKMLPSGGLSYLSDSQIHPPHLVTSD